MSWSAKYTVTKEVDNEPSVVVEYEQTQNGHGENESKVALRLAKDTAVSMIRTSKLGDSCKFNVGLSGHANPDNQKSPGWSNDFVTIAISQL